MTPDDVIAVMRALKKGKIIQRKSYSSENKWVDCDMKELMDRSAVQYRIKPEPKRK